MPRSFILLGIVAYACSIYFERSLAGFAIDTLPLRIFVVATILPFLFRDSWPPWLARRGHIYWCFAIGVMLPFCFGVILALNHAAPESEDLNHFAVTEYILAMFFLVQILLSLRLIFVVWAAASFAVACVVALSGGSNLTLLTESLFYVLPFSLTILLVGAIVNNSLFNFQKEKEVAVRAVANAVAHQLRTPLATIRNLSSGTKNQLAPLTQAYDIALGEGLITDTIGARKYSLVSTALDEIGNEVNHANGLIDILIANSRPFDFASTEVVPISIVNVVQRAVSTYPYNNHREKNMIMVEHEPDFQVLGIEQLLLHTFYNLIANGVEFCQKRPGGQVRIWFELGRDWNRVFVWDSGIGIPRNHVHRVFDPFFSSNSMNGTGIGLSFCKSVMEGVGGKIECISKENEYTQFTLFFPATGD